jgi:uncharacterized protein (TIGR03663 family)
MVGSSARNAAKAAASAPPGQTERAEISTRVWWIASLSLLAVAAFVRLYALDLKPMHHDEGVNGFFLTNLYRDGVYHYDPENYHGPTLYYFALVITKLKAFLFGEPGLSTVAVRLVPALFGIGTVWLALQLRRHIGTIGALVAAALIALSPGNVYISRYFIHETPFVFFTLGVVVAALRYWETADHVYLMLASISAALLFATKETSIITIPVLGLAWAVAAVYMRLAESNRPVAWEKKRATGRRAKKRGALAEKPGAKLERFGGVSSVTLMAGLALLVFVFVNVLFYSSFFTHWEGVKDAIESFQIWAKTGTKDHTHKWYTYLWWLIQEEAPLLLLGAAGSLLALINRKSRFAIFAGAWAFGILAAYSLIPYKTPWLMLSFTVPLGVISGYAVNELYHWGKSRLTSGLALAVAFAAISVCAVQATRLNFYRYDDEKYPYVYAHTYREFLSLLDEIDRLAKRAGTDKKTGITITAREYWPLPWYMRDYPHAGFWGQMVATTQEPIVVGTADQEQKLAAMLGDNYLQINAYPLRPGVTLLLYARRDLIGE